tara:strand:+ start:495 stop:1190 length:696 start_codon:yes stop_codon:yes gene_type:complete
MPSDDRKKLRHYDKPKKRKPRKLTSKQELFIKELITKDGQITLREAAINAGYSPRSAHNTAYELLNPSLYPHVVAEYQKYKKEIEGKYSVKYERHLRDLQRIRDKALEEGAFSAAVQAEYRRGQASGNIYINKSEIRHGSIDSMSREEVERALNEIKNSYAIDITPEPEEEEDGKIDRLESKGDAESGAKADSRGEEEGERVVGELKEVCEGDEADMETVETRNVGNAGDS